MMFSHLRTPDEYRRYRSIYEEAGGHGLVAANRPVYVGSDDASAANDVEPALRRLWRRFQSEGKIPADRDESPSLHECAAHPINFLFGGPESVARQIDELREYVDFDVLNLEPRWAGLTVENVHKSLHRLAAVNEGMRE